MEIPAAPAKTQLGLDELRGRARTLGQRHRTVLLLVDGRRALSEVLSLAQQAGAQTSHFEDLVRMGMVELPREAIAPDARDTAASAFDTLRVTSVEFDVPAVALPGEFGRETPGLAEAPVISGQRDIEVELPGMASTRAVTPAALPSRVATPVALEPAVREASPTHEQGHPPVTAAAPAVALPPPAPELRERQMPLTEVPRAMREPPTRTGDAGNRTAPAPARPETPRLLATDAPISRPTPLAADPLTRAPAPSARKSNPAAQAPAAAKKPGPLPSRADSGTKRPGTPSAVRAEDKSAAMQVPPTLSMGSVADAVVRPPASTRRTVLARLASPRAGSLRVPDEPATDRLERVRELLVETLRLDAPIFGVRMLVRLRAATGIDDLIELVWEIERHLMAARHSRDEMLNLHRARELLGLGNTVVADDD